MKKFTEWLFAVLAFVGIAWGAWHLLGKPQRQTPRKTGTETDNSRQENSKEDQNKQTLEKVRNGKDRKEFISKFYKILIQSEQVLNDHDKGLLEKHNELLEKDLDSGSFDGLVKFDAVKDFCRTWSENRQSAESRVLNAKSVDDFDKLKATIEKAVEREGWAELKTRADYSLQAVSKNVGRKWPQDWPFVRTHAVPASSIGFRIQALTETPGQNAEPNQSKKDEIESVARFPLLSTFECQALLVREKFLTDERVGQNLEDLNSATFNAGEAEKLLREGLSADMLSKLHREINAERMYVLKELESPSANTQLKESFKGESAKAKAKAEKDLNALYDSVLDMLDSCSRKMPPPPRNENRSLIPDGPLSPPANLPQPPNGNLQSR